MRVMVTGGLGFIGSHLVRVLLARGDEVRIVDTAPVSLSASGRTSDGSYCYHEDISDPFRLGSLFEGIDTVYHLAAMGSVPRCEANPADAFRNNVVGTWNVLAYAHGHGVRRVVCASSASVYGSAQAWLMSDNGPIAPQTVYGGTKAAAEGLCASWRSRGLDVVVLRPFNVYGPGQRADGPYSAIIPKWIDNARSNNILIVHGDGRQTRDFCYVDDCVRAFLLATGVDRESLTENPTFNVSGRGRTSVLQLAEMISSLAGKKLQRQHTSGRHGDIKHSMANLSRSASILGYEPEVEFAEGLRRTFESRK